MNDLEKLKATFDAMGLRYAEWLTGSGEVVEDGTALEIGCGSDGDSGAVCQFWFDGDGKFVEHSVMNGAHENDE